MQDGVSLPECIEFRSRRRVAAAKFVIQSIPASYFEAVPFRLLRGIDRITKNANSHRKPSIPFGNTQDCGFHL